MRQSLRRDSWAGGEHESNPGRDGTNAVGARPGRSTPPPHLTAAGRQAPRPRRGGRLVSIAMVIASIGVSMALAEVVLRAVPAALPGNATELRPTPGVAHPYIGHLHTPHSQVVVESRDFRVVHDTDGHGFRNAWPWPERAEIVAVGDSLTFGYGVTAGESWPSVLARALPAVVVNLGLVGTSAPQYLRVYEVFGTGLQPRLLVVGVFARNDFWDAGLFERWLRSGVGGNYMHWRDGGQRAATEPDHSADSVLRRAVAAAGSSAIVRLARHVWRQQTEERRYFFFRDGSRLELLPDDFASTTIGSEAGRPEYRLVLDALLTLHQRAREGGTAVLVALLPSKEEVYLPLLGVTARDPAGDLRQALRQHGIDHMDLLPLFRARAAAGQRLFFESDGHPNAEGYALIAEGLLPHLRREILDAR